VNILNILFLSHRLPYPANKGEKIRTFNQIKHLVELGHSITVFSAKESQLDLPLNEQFNQIKGIDSTLFNLPFKPVRLLNGLFSGASLSEANFYSKELQVALDEKLTTGEFDAIVCSSSAMSKYLLDSKVLLKLQNKPTLLMDFMDLDSDKWLQYAGQSQWPMSWLYNRESKKVSKLEAQSQNLFDACYFIADAEVQLFKERQNGEQFSNVKVLGNGLNTSEFYPPTPAAELNNDAPIFIFTGVMDYKPNVDAVMWFVKECWAEVRAKYENAQFIIAGMNPVPEISSLADKDGIVVTGFVDDILPYYHKANFFVAPFRIARGVQNKVLQAFACKLPVITTPMGAEGIDCVDGQHLLLANTAEQFIDAIDKLNADPVLSQSVAQNGLSLIQEQFSWQGKLKPLVQDLGLSSSYEESH